METTMKTTAPPARTSAVALVALLLVVALVGGCRGRLAREGVGFFRGAQGSVTPLRSQWSATREYPLAEYTQFELGEFTDAMLGRVPEALFSELKAAWPEALIDADILSRPGGKTLRVEGEVLHFEDASSTLDVMVSPFGEVVARVRLIDAATGQVLAEGNCVGRAKATVNLGVDKKARGLAKAIAEWLATLRPEPAEQ
jgi:hypothetical protein